MAYAVDEGRRQHAAECADLSEAIGMMTAESERADGELAKAHERLRDTEAQREAMIRPKAKTKAQ